VLDLWEETTSEQQWDAAYAMLPDDGGIETREAWCVWVTKWPCGCEYTHTGGESHGDSLVVCAKHAVQPDEEGADQGQEPGDAHYHTR
jgi:hypothetical protein